MIRKWSNYRKLTELSINIKCLVLSSTKMMRLKWQTTHLRYLRTVKLNLQHQRQTENSLHLDVQWSKLLARRAAQHHALSVLKSFSHSLLAADVINLESQTLYVLISYTTNAGSEAGFRENSNCHPNHPFALVKKPDQTSSVQRRNLGCYHLHPHLELQIRKKYYMVISCRWLTF